MSCILFIRFVFTVDMLVLVTTKSRDSNLLLRFRKLCKAIDQFYVMDFTFSVCWICFCVTFEFVKEHFSGGLSYSRLASAPIFLAG